MSRWHMRDRHMPLRVEGGVRTIAALEYNRDLRIGLRLGGDRWLLGSAWGAVGLEIGRLLGAEAIVDGVTR